MEDIAKRFQRLLWILQQLSSSGGTTSGRLADLYKVSQRTIQRDIIDLKRANFEISSQGRRHWLAAGEGIPGQQIELADVLSQGLGLSLMSTEAGPGNQALSKLAAFVKGDLSVETTPATPQALLPELMRAIDEKRKIRFAYHGGAIRTVEPWNVFYQSAWFMQGLEDGGEPRVFRFSRIRDLELLEDTFEVPSGHRVDKEIFHRWDMTDGRRRKIIGKVSADLARFLEANPVHPSQKVEEGVLELHVRDLDQVAAWAVSQDGLEIEQPADLRQAVRTRATEMARKHGRRVARDEALIL